MKYFSHALILALWIIWLSYWIGAPALCQKLPFAILCEQI
jgi:hypothetical protein